MSESTDFRLASRGVFWRSGICLLLAVLFLYSPFFTIYSSSHVLKVQSTFSFRGTLGASELRRFTVSHTQFSCDTSEQACFDSPVIFATPSLFGRAAMFGRLLVPPQFFLASSFSRPPPLN